MLNFSSIDLNHTQVSSLTAKNLKMIVEKEEEKQQTLKGEKKVLVEIKEVKK